MPAAVTLSVAVLPLLIVVETGLVLMLAGVPELMLTVAVFELA